jgi:tetratricopeptide (TPR) repeat protein
MPWEQEAPAEVVHPEATAWEPVEPVAQPAAAPETPSTVEVSDWLTNLDEPEPVAAAPAEKPAGESEDLPAWLKDASADENPPAPEPGFGWVAAQLAAKKEALGLGSSSREPASEPPAEVVPPPQPAPAPVKQVPPPQRPALRQTGMLGSDKDAQAVQRARDSLSHGGLDAAMNEYTKLIKKNKMLEDVIYDLQEAVYSHPVDVIVWQTLGDAYMRSNRLQDALDAYSKAEELLR